MDPEQTTWYAQNAFQTFQMLLADEFWDRPLVSFCILISFCLVQLGYLLHHQKSGEKRVLIEHPQYIYYSTICIYAQQSLTGQVNFILL